MSTRCNLIIKDEFHSIQLYRHCDGYPDSEYGVVNCLKGALNYAWELPRMGASDFAAAIVRAWKDHGGNIYIDGSHNSDADLHGDIEYLYEIEPDKEAKKWGLKVFVTPSSCAPNPSSGAPEYRAKRGKIVFAGHIGDDY